MPTPDPVPAPDPAAEPDRWSGFDTAAHHAAQDACHHLIHCAVDATTRRLVGRPWTPPARSVTSPRFRCGWPS
jgi:hypothetical protein